MPNWLKTTIAAILSALAAVVAVLLLKRRKPATPPPAPISEALGIQYEEAVEARRKAVEAAEANRLEQEKSVAKALAENRMEHLQIDACETVEDVQRALRRLEG